MTGLSHIGADGTARMVDVTDKPVTGRTATARGHVAMAPATIRMIADGTAPKGDVLAAARIAGIMAAKRTGDLIPLCHPLPIEAVTVDLMPDADAGRVEISATCRTTGRTGVEMEALTAVSIAALTLYDMVKAVDKAMVIGDIRLVAKTGGRSGDIDRDPVPDRVTS